LCLYKDKPQPKTAECSLCCLGKNRSAQDGHLSEAEQIPLVPRVEHPLPAAVTADNEATKTLQVDQRENDREIQAVVHQATETPIPITERSPDHTESDLSSEPRSKHFLTLDISSKEENDAADQKTPMSHSECLRQEEHDDGHQEKTPQSREENFDMEAIQRCSVIGEMEVNHEVTDLYAIHVVIMIALK